MVEAAAVATICAARGIAHTTLTVDLVPGSALQERARAARYAVLGDWAMSHGLSALVTAHHADDQAETLLMRLNRGAGVRGLASMRRVSVVPGRSKLALLRPLLGWRRRDLAAVVEAAGIKAADDPSNADMRFERARVRAGIAGAAWLDCGAMAGSASHLAEADRALDWAADRAFAAAKQMGPLLSWAPEETPRTITLRVLERIVTHFGCSTPRGSGLARWHDHLASGQIATLAGVRGDGRDAIWRFTAAPLPRSRTIN